MVFRMPGDSFQRFSAKWAVNSLQGPKDMVLLLSCCVRDTPRQPCSAQDHMVLEIKPGPAAYNSSNPVIPFSPPPFFLG